MLEKRLGDLTHLLQCGGLVPLDALLSVGAVIPFDIGILVRPMRGTNMGFDAQTEQEST
jgi:hypothetical protein